MMKKILFVMLMALLILAGCTEQKPPAPRSDNQPNTNHLIAEQSGVTVEVSKDLKTFPKEMIATKDGLEVVGLSVIIINETTDNLPISPDYVTLVAVDGTEFKYSEITEITGKGAFKKVALPPDYRGGGLLLFEIKKDTKINKLLFKDEKNHEITINFDSAKSTKV